MATERDIPRKPRLTDENLQECGIFYNLTTYEIRSQGASTLPEFVDNVRRTLLEFKKDLHPVYMGRFAPPGSLPSPAAAWLSFDEVEEPLNRFEKEKEEVARKDTVSSIDAAAVFEQLAYNNEAGVIQALSERIFEPFKRTKFLFESERLQEWRLVHSVLWNMFSRWTNNDAEIQRRCYLPNPKPDISYGFPIYRPDDKLPAAIFANNWAKLFSYDFLRSNCNNDGRGLKSAPTKGLSSGKDIKDLGDPELLCYPWAVVEIKRATSLPADGKDCYRRAANSSAAALEIQDSLLKESYGHLYGSESSGQFPTVAFTCVGPEIKVWLAYTNYKHAPLHRNMQCIYETDLRHPWGVFSIRSIIKNMLLWACQTVRPKLASCLQVIELREHRVSKNTANVEQASNAHKEVNLKLNVDRQRSKDYAENYTFNTPTSRPHRQTSPDRELSPPDGSHYESGNASAASDDQLSSKRRLNSTTLFQIPLELGEFRLLHRVGREPLAFTLRTCKIEYPPQYRALSYAWAAQEKDRALLCYSQDRTVQSIVQISETIQDALSELTTEDMLIWVDAVCIDQANHVEKSQQVQVMHRIYSKAHDVAIWLGKQQDDSALALDVLKWISAPPARGEQDKSLPLFPALQHHLDYDRTPLHLDQVQNLAATVHESEYVPTNRLYFQRLRLPNFDHPIWPALGFVLSPRWFSRLWTLQELLLARDSFVACGNKHVPWRTYFDVGMQFSYCNLLSHCFSQLSYSIEYKTRASTAFLRLAPFLSTDNNVIPFWQYLEEARNRDATEAVDRIYGMLSFANDNLRSKINVDYSAASKAQFWRVFIEAAKAIMATSSMQAVLTSVNSVSKSGELPSWCPDFSQPCEAKPFGSYARAGFGYAKSFVPHYNFKMICIGGTRLCEISEVMPYSWSWPEDLTHIYGPKGKAAENRQWLDTCWSITQRKYEQDDTSAQRAFILTVLGEIPPPQSLEDRAADITWFNEKENDLNELRHWLENLQVCAGPQDVDVSSNVWNRFQTMSRRLNDIWHNRRFCTTNNGRIGFGSHRMRPGDHVAIFFGESHVYILRSQPAGVYEFISDGYIEGYMIGRGNTSRLDSTAFKLI